MSAGIRTAKRSSTTGDFYPTPPSVGMALREFWLDRYSDSGWAMPRKIIDPCAGVGCLLASWVSGKDEEWRTPASKPDPVYILGLEERADLEDAALISWRDNMSRSSPILLADGAIVLEEWGKADQGTDLPGSLLVVNPPFQDCDEWVHLAVTAARKQGMHCAILLRSQWLDDGNTRGRHVYRFATGPLGPRDSNVYPLTIPSLHMPPTAILRIPWRISFDGRGANACSYAWHIWAPGNHPPACSTYWAHSRETYDPPSSKVELWNSAAVISAGEH